MNHLTEGIEKIEIEIAIKDELGSSVLTVLLPENASAVLEAFLQQELQDVFELKQQLQVIFTPVQNTGKRQRLANLNMTKTCEEKCIFK